MGNKKNIKKAKNPTITYIICLCAKTSFASFINKNEKIIIGNTSNGNIKSKWVKILPSSFINLQPFAKFVYEYDLKRLILSKIVASEIERIDIYLAKVLGQSRSQISNLIKNQNVLVNNKVIKSSYKLNINDEIEINYPDIKDINIKYEANFDVEILYEDEYMLVVNKPNNVATHGCSSLKEASLVEWLLERNYKLADINGKIRAGIVHRLDKDTSGVMLVAKSNEAYFSLANQIKNREVNRIYLAVTNHTINQNHIEKYIKRNENNRLKMQSLSKDECIKKYGLNEDRWGKWARTHFINLANTNDKALISAKLESGRTHQIRTHLASVNRYILGDSIYADESSKNKANRLMLHSFYINYTHPITNNFMEFYSSNCLSFNEAIKDFKDIKLDLNLAHNLLNQFSNNLE